MNPFVYRENPSIMTPEVVEIARHQVEQQEEMDELLASIENTRRDVRDLKADILARTKRIQELEMLVRKGEKDLTLAVAMLSDLLSDILPARDAKIVSQINVLFARLQSAEESIDHLEGE